MLDWVIKPYDQLEDISMITSHLLAQLLGATIGLMAIIAMCWGLTKLLMLYYTR